MSATAHNSSEKPNKFETIIQRFFQLRSSSNGENSSWKLILSIRGVNQRNFVADQTPAEIIRSSFDRILIPVF